MITWLENREQKIENSIKLVATLQETRYKK